MKKLLILSIFALFLFAGSNVFGQSTGKAPFPGAKHPYSVSSGTGTKTWSVTKGDLATPATAAQATLDATTGDAINVTWGSAVTPNDVYYVHILENLSGCLNEKVLKVVIHQNDFKLAITSSATSCYDGPVGITLDASGEPIYDHKNATLKYTVTASGVSGTEGWQFDFANDLPLGVNAAAPTISSGSGTVGGSTITVTTGTSVELTFVVDNTNTTTNSADFDGSKANYTSKVDISNGKTAKGVVDNTLGTYTSNTIVDRPHTSEITTN